MFSFASSFTDLGSGSKFYKLLFYFPLLLDTHTQICFKQLAMNYLYYSDLCVTEVIPTIFTALKSFNSIQQSISLPGNNSQREMDYIFHSLGKKFNIDGKIHTLFFFFFLTHSVKENKYVHGSVLRMFVNTMNSTG